jgi:hypothetical protein
MSAKQKVLGVTIRSPQGDTSALGRRAGLNGGMAEAMAQEGPCRKTLSPAPRNYGLRQGLNIGSGKAGP